jgi:hypothetical protein
MQDDLKAKDRQLNTIGNYKHLSSRPNSSTLPQNSNPKLMMGQKQSADPNNIIQNIIHTNSGRQVFSNQNLQQRNHSNTGQAEEKKVLDSQINQKMRKSEKYMSSFN